jgi:carboxyl-terminal processing protease
MNLKRTLLNYLIYLTAFGLTFAAGYFLHARLFPGDSDFSLPGQAFQLIENHGYYDLPEGSQMEYGAIRGMLDTYGDRFTYFVEPAQHELSNDSLAGSYGGIGATLERTPEGETVLHPFENSPAMQAGIKDGDRLIAVDDVEINAEMTLDEVVAAVRGPEGKRVHIKVVRPPEGQVFEFSIKRENIPLPSVTWHLAASENRVGVIQVNLIAASTEQEIQNAVTDLKERGATYFVLDLRGNRGGLLDAGVNIARLFLTEGVILEKQNRGKDPETYEVEEPGALASIPLVVLVDENTASAAEIVAGALQAHQRALLIGTHTFGKDSIQLVFELKDGSSLHVTNALWWVPGLENPIGEGGLQPDIAVSLEGSNEVDPFIETAIRTLLEIN